MSLPTRVWLYGRDEDLPARKELRAGPLTLLLERGDLRSIRFDGREVVNRVYVAIRDRNWGTIAPVLSNVDEKIGKDSFRVSFDVENREREIHFVWKGVITGDPDGTITFSMEGMARSTFMRNRIGFCILHPAECAGARCRVWHASGTVEDLAFPTLIAPHQPFLDIRAIEHEVCPGVRAKLELEGDVFEMEDQRNWTDASFKTYCTPLSRPFPEEIREGTAVSQTVTLRLDATSAPRRSAPGKAAREPVVLSIDTSRCGRALPRLGLGMASHGGQLSGRELSLLRHLGIDHLRVDVEPSRTGAYEVLQRAKTAAASLDAGLEIAVHLSDAAQRDLAWTATTVRDLGCRVARWLVFHVSESSTSSRWITAARSALADVAPDAPIVAGSNAYFTELNRGEPPVSADAVVYSVNPQIHAFDNWSLMETLATQAVTIQSAVHLSGGKPVVVSPVTLKPRFNAVATGPIAPPAPGELPDQVDPRQMSLFGAAWTLGSFANLLRGGVASVTWYETTGWRGVMETAGGSPLPEKFRSLPGCVFPLYHALAFVGDMRGGREISGSSSDPRRIDGLTMESRGRMRTIVANTTEAGLTAVIVGGGRRCSVRMLDETNVETACREPEAYRENRGPSRATRGGEVRFNLGRYAIACVDWEV